MRLEGFRCGVQRLHRRLILLIAMQVAGEDESLQHVETTLSFLVVANHVSAWYFLASGPLALNGEHYDSQPGTLFSV
ncbi:MAG: hypothetical protein H8E27_06960 [Verrucomicrobia subdivision 3 bacterium]|nr:hypothetical protein [Limisphaerales bacterium]